MLGAWMSTETSIFFVAKTAIDVRLGFLLMGVITLLKDGMRSGVSSLSALAVLSQLQLSIPSADLVSILSKLHIPTTDLQRASYVAI